MHEPNASPEQACPWCATDTGTLTHVLMPMASAPPEDRGNPAAAEISGPIDPEWR